MTINPILAIIAVVVFISGVVVSSVVNIIFFIKSRRAFPEIYRNKSIVWKDKTIIEDAINSLNDKNMLSLYKWSRQAPLISVVLFAVIIMIVIVTAK